MISIRILEAQNLPTVNGHASKTIISCYSFSSYRFYIGSFTSKDKSTNPKWNIEFKIELFRLINLRFALFGYRSNHNNIYIGDVAIPFNQFISTSPGNQILESSETSIRFEFPITNCKSSNAELSLVFQYFPSIYRPIKFKKSSNYNSYIHIWSTYSPGIQSPDPQVEIELFQTIKMPSEKKGQKISLSYFLNKNVSWESIGNSSLKQCINGPTGLTQVHTLSLPQISGIFSFFVLNVSTFSGKVSLHFLFESKTKAKYIDDKFFIKPKKKKPSIGTIKVIEINVESNKKYFVPFYMYYETNPTKSNIFEFNQFGSETEMPTFDVKSISKDADYSDLMSSENEFGSQIIEKVRSIHYFSQMNFLRTNIFPIVESVSLQKTLRDYNLQQESILRFYIGGSTTNSSAGYLYINYWHQYFIAYDKTNGQICPEISKTYTSETPNNEPPKKSNSFLPISMDWNSILTLNFDQIGTDKVLIYCVFCRSSLQSAFPYGFFMISHLKNNDETLLFYNPIFVDAEVCTCAVFFRIEYLQNDWKIIPMKHYFRKRNQMEFCIDSMHSNNWNLPNIDGNNNDLAKSPLVDDNDDYLINDF